ncbi:MAG: 23S rRNA (guanosine(2251)-2'-O)-methyltransferase RlmB [Aminobacterium colombiense]|nr:23S rRNA (guanosine(2251)-2'-O)-methyltransferase RlmB [Aminobacterium colombiense]
MSAKQRRDNSKPDSKKPYSRKMENKKRENQKPYGKKPYIKMPDVRKQIDEDLIWGRQPVLDLLQYSPQKCLKVWISERAHPSFSGEVMTLARSTKVPFQKVASTLVDEMCPGENHQGAVAKITMVEQLDMEDFLPTLKTKEGPILLVVLDHILDPHNLGAIIRTAEAAGATAVVYSKRRSALPGGTVVKVSAGAALRVPMISVTNIAQTITRLQEEDFWVVGLDHNAPQSLWGATYPDKSSIVVGAEGEGLSRLVAQRCDMLLRIPITGKTGSLNAGVAAALGMFEWARAKGVDVHGE